MTLVNYEPNTILNRLRDQLNKMYSPDLQPSLWDDQGSVFSNSWMPTVDVKEAEDKFQFLADIPGVNPEDIDVTCENGVLTIKGERKFAADDEKEGYRRIERSRGSFFRRFLLPDAVDADHIKASSKNGVLELTIPKAEKAKPRKIEIKS